MFYWREITKQAKDLVSYICALRSACARLHEQIILIKQLAGYSSYVRNVM